MKKFTLLLATMLLSVMSYAADEVYKTALFGSNYNSKGLSSYKNSWSATNGGFQVDIVNANNNNNGWEYLKMGSKSAAYVGTITTHDAIDEAITKVVLTIDAATSNSINSLKLKTSTDTITWTEAGSFTVAKGDQSVVLATPTANLYYQVVADCKKGSSNGLIQISKVTYYKAAAAVAVADPIISAKNNEVAIENNGFYTSALTITLACETEGATIHYTLDGSEPTAESATYSEALTFTNQFVTLRAKAFKGEGASYEATANYYHNSSLEVPYTTTQAVALNNALGDVAEIFVEGQVTNFEYNSTYKNANYTITDGTTPLYLYRGVAGKECGLDSLANLEQGDKVVVKGTLTAYKGTPQLGEGNTIVKWTENTNPVLSCVESVAFGTISSLVGTAPSKTLEVTAKNLTEDITATLSEGAAFTLSTTTLPAEGGTIEITPILTIGEHTATLTLTSGETSVKVALSATIKQAYTISWSVNGKVTSTSHVIDGENLVLPATPEAPNECASKVFVGWATTATVAADGKDIVFVDAATPATADATYYAVFATATESETPAVAEVTFSNMFSDVTSSKDIDGVALVITDGITVTFAKSTSGSSKAQYYDNGKAVRLYGGGSITINSIVTITSFMLTFGANDGSNALTADCGTWESPTWTGSANTIVLSEEGTTGHRRIAGISVTTKQTTWEEYTTTCTDTPSAIDNATVETSVIKTIENGKLVIMRDGVKYNAMGVRLQ